MASVTRATSQVGLAFPPNPWPLRNPGTKEAIPSTQILLVMESWGVIPREGVREEGPKEIYLSGPPSNTPILTKCWHKRMDTNGRGILSFVGR